MNEPPATYAKDIPTDGVKLELRRYGSDAGRPVLLLHGASASRDTFFVPNGGLVAWLGARGFDVWTLDWRGSHRVVDPLVDPPRGTSYDAAREPPEYRRFTLDRAAEVDVPAALAEMRRELATPKPVAVLAHCFGAGLFSVAIARGQAEGVDRVVLLTLGLFYEVPWDGWIKAEDLILERVLAHDPSCRAIDPRRPERWPSDMVNAYESYPKAWLPPRGDQADDILHRLAFMFGEPYPKHVLAPGIHGPRLRELFGAMHIGLYLHAGQLVRRGYAAAFDELDVIDRPRLDDGPRVPAAGKDLRERRLARGYGRRVRRPARSDLVHAPFQGKRITLITGAQNRLWHRDSIDLMYEWLLAVPPQGDGARPVKHVLRNYAHQDLLWGKNAHDDVYGLIEEALRR